MTALMICGSYLLGAIPAGYLLYLTLTKSDIRKSGSRNIGATNVLRTAGWQIAIPVLLFDIGKGFFPVYLAHRWFDQPWIAAAAGLAAILGHCFPVYIGFRGGKGVATTVGACFGLAPMPFFFIIAVFFAVVALTRYVSLASLSATLAYPVFAAVWRSGPEVILFGAMVFLLVTFQHRENIQRLKNGTERKIGGKEQ